jgi:nicotinamidase-related amidase
VNDCFLAVDVLNDFSHVDGGRLHESLRARIGGFVSAWQEARGARLPVAYANDSFGDWSGDAHSLVKRALAGAAADILPPLAPLSTDVFIVKPRYSAFDLTPLRLVLKEMRIERLLLAGAATEMCVAQTAIDARELGLKVTVVTSACATVDCRLERVALEYLEGVTGTMLAGSVGEALVT